MNSSRHDPEHGPSANEGHSREDVELQALARLFREHAPVEPSPEAWQRTFSRIEAGVGKPAPGRRSWPMYFLVGLVATAAAMFAGIMIAQERWPIQAGNVERPRDFVVAKPVEVIAEEEPFPVALASEVHILSMNPNDADRVVMLGPPILGEFAFATAEDIVIVEMEPSPKTKSRKPHLQCNKGAPAVIVARGDDEEDDEEP